jgi:outer membrane protein assembly factor BamB
MKAALGCGCVWLATLVAAANASAATTGDLGKNVGTNRGVVVLLGLPEGDAASVVRFAGKNELVIFFQSADAAQVAAVRKAADEAGLLGERIFADVGPFDAVQLGDNVADGVLAADSVNVADAELLRVLRPRASALVGDRKLTKPVPEGADDWTHPYHGPDNNPNSSDQLVRGELRTQFLGFPQFSPMPEQTVVAGGRMFKAMGHIAHKANQNELLNTLLCINAYNGTILWKRPLPKGFMIHRNTMIATGDALYLGDTESCKVIDAVTGEVREELTVDPKLSDGPVWKWMAMRDGVLYAMLGNREIEVDVQLSDRPGLGHWPWAMWQGHDYADPRTSFGFGRTIVAIDLATNKPLWHYRDDDYLDGRALCMNDKHIFCYSPQKFLAAIDLKTGKAAWKNSDKELLEAIGENGRAQHYITGYATTCYMKCNDDYLFFAGPQRPRLTVASAKDGKLAWTYGQGNLQLVLRNDGVWAAGPQQTSGAKLEYATGKVLEEFPARRACTRATGCADSVFFRASGGTVRVMTESNAAQHIAPMRPPCQDGVLVAAGHLYWGPWMCGCQLSLYGNIGLGAAESQAKLGLGENALVRADNFRAVKRLDVHENDWPSYRGGNDREDVARVALPDDVELLWQADVSGKQLPTAPVVAGGLVFVADGSGAVQAFDEEGKLVWKTYTGGPIYYPPAVAEDRVFVGSADGRVYALEALSGRVLWSYRVGPRERRIRVYDKLISTWPVAGGVVVQDGAVYAAAGIAHYDGTYVVALDAVTGEVKARNDSSGTISPEVNNGISVQGNLTIVDGELRFLAGGVYETARYDLKSLRCLNEPLVQVSSQYRTAFYPYYPEYGKFVSLDYACEDGCQLSHDASYEGNKFTNLTFFEPLPEGARRPVKEAARWNLPRSGDPAKVLWQDRANRRFTSFIISGDRLLAAGHTAEKPDERFLAAIDIRKGSTAWVVALPADAVTGGTVIDHRGRIYVSLENGKLLCYAPK